MIQFRPRSRENELRRTTGLHEDLIMLHRVGETVRHERQTGTVTGELLERRRLAAGFANLAKHTIFHPVRSHHSTGFTATPLTSIVKCR